MENQTTKTRCEPASGLRERQRAARNAAILQAAFDLISDKGYEAMTMDAVAERVGISRQTLYHHFPSKEAIALRAILALFEQGIQAIEELGPGLSPLARLERVARWMLERRFSPALAAFVRAKPSLVPLKAHPEYRRAFERRADAIDVLVRDAQTAGEVRRDLPSRLIVQMLLGMVSEANYDDLIGGGQATPQQITDAVTETFLRGIRGTEAS